MNNNVEKFASPWSTLIHVPFKKVVKHDLFLLGIGAIIWIGFEVLVYGKVIGV